MQNHGAGIGSRCWHNHANLIHALAAKYYKPKEKPHHQNHYLPMLEVGGWASDSQRQLRRTSSGSAPSGTNFGDTAALLASLQ